MKSLKFIGTFIDKFFLLIAISFHLLSIACTMNASISSLSGSTPDPNKNYISFKTNNNGQNAEGSILDLTLNEGGLLVFSLLLAKPAEEDTELTVILTSADDPANSQSLVASRFSSITDKIKIKKGESLGYLSLQTNSDSTYQSQEENFSLVLASNSQSIDTSLAKINLKIHDPSPAPEVYFSIASQNLNENLVSAGNVTISLSKPSNKALQVKIKAVDGTALQGIDYNFPLQTINFSSGETSKTITIPLIDRAGFQPSRSFKLELFEPYIVTLGSQLEHTVQILDDDSLVANFSVSSQTVNEASGTLLSGWSSSLSAWSARKMISLSNTGSTLTNFPVMIKLNSTRIDYSKTQSAGQDLRFTDTSGNILPHEIEYWDSTGNSIVWVKIPTFTGSTNTSIWMYYNNPVSIDGQDRLNVWDSNHQGVWHLSGTAQDSTTNAKNGSITGASTSTTLVGRGLNFSSTNYVSVPDGMLANNSVMTVEGWFKTSQTDMVIMGWANQSYPTSATNYVPTLYIGSDNKLRAEQWMGASTPITTTTDVNDDQWHYAVLTVNSNTQSLYVDGNLIGSLAGNIVLYPNTKNYIGMGYSLNWPNTTSSGWRSMNGYLDEFRISNVVRSAAWIQMNNLNVRDGIASFFNEEANSSAMVDITIQLTGNAPSTVTIPFTISGTATNGTDYDFSATDFTILAGSSSATKSLRIIRDNSVEPTETVILTMGTPVGALAGATNVHTININNEVLNNPTAVNDSYSLSNLSPTYLPVLNNDSDINGDAIALASINSTSLGTATILGNQIYYVPTSQFSGTETISYTISDGRGGSSSATVTLNFQIPFTWTGLGSDSNWNTAGNWLGNSVPNASSNVYFNNQCSSQCNATINIDASAGAVQLNPSYTGTITQNSGIKLTIGSGGWTQYAGTFNGSNAQISSEKIYLAGGLFNSTSGDLVLGKSSVCTTVSLLTVLNNSYFSAGSGNIKLIHSRGTFQSCHSTANLYTPSGFSVNNLSVDVAQSTGGWYSYYTAPNGFPITANGNLYLDGARLTFPFEVKGNYDFGNYAICSDVLGSIKLNGSGAQTYAASSGCSPQIIIDKSAGGVTPSNTNNLKAMALDIRSGAFDLASNSTLYLGSQNCQTYTLLKVPNSGATFNLNNSNIVFDFGRPSGGSCSPVGTIDVPIGFHFNNLTISGQPPGSGWHSNITSTNTLNIMGNLNHNAAALNFNSNLYGNLSFSANTDYGTGAINFVGATDQFISSSPGGFPSGAITINKTGGVVKLLNAISFSNAGQSLNINTGNTFDMNSFNFTFAGTINNSGTLQRGTIASSCGVLSVGSLLGNASICP